VSAFNCDINARITAKALRHIFGLIEGKGALTDMDTIHLARGAAGRQGGELLVNVQADLDSP
jgi:hypothetical protein